MLSARYRWSVAWAGLLIMIGCASSTPPGVLALRRKHEIHRVRKGETIYSIARDYDVSVGELIDLNGIDRPERIFAGQQILIPGERIDGAPSPLPQPRKAQRATRRTRAPAASSSKCDSVRPHPETGSRQGLLFPPVKGRARRRPRNKDRAQAVFDARPGSPVWAAADGEVIFAGRREGYGLVVTIRHRALNSTTVYGRTGGLCVDIGTRVRRGQVVAVVAESDKLVFEVRAGNDPGP